MINAAYEAAVDFPPKEQIEEAERWRYGSNTRSLLRRIGRH
jgi:hypothetical protein